MHATQASGSYFPSFTSAFLEDGVKTDEEDFLLKWAGFAIYGGGADTVSVSSISSWSSDFNILTTLNFID